MSQVIPAAAVEAAAAAMYAAMYADPFENQKGEGRQEFLTMARAALEAATEGAIERLHEYIRNEEGSFNTFTATDDPTSIGVDGLLDLTEIVRVILGVAK